MAKAPPRRSYKLDSVILVPPRRLAEAPRPGTWSFLRYEGTAKCCRSLLRRTAMPGLRSTSPARRARPLPHCLPRCSARSRPVPDDPR
jgi:hypothetical protein